MLVDADDGAVDGRILEIRVAGQTLEQALDDSGLRPATKAPEHSVSGAECLGQIAPGCPSAHHPQHRFQEQPVIRAGTPGITCFARQKRRDTLPLFVLEHPPIQS
jgi:hypothetical protein